MRLREVFVTIKIKINSRFLFCREDEDERHKACLCWKGYVHIGRKTAHFETLHIQEPVRAEVLLFQVNVPCSFNTTACPYCWVTNVQLI